MNLMALIPVRAGSKGLKNKNLLPFGKNSLVERTFHLVEEILEKEKVVLSSDYKFEAFSKFLKKSQYRQRPKFLSEDIWYLSRRKLFIKSPSLGLSKTIIGIF